MTEQSHPGASSADRAASHDAGTAAGVPTGAPRQVSVRRAPRYRAFVLTGVAIGAVLAALPVQLFPDTGRFSTGSVFGYLAVSLGLFGGLLGAGLALLLERRS